MKTQDKAEKPQI